jgi:hypothetical protein
MTLAYIALGLFLFLLTGGLALMCHKLGED